MTPRLALEPAQVAPDATVVVARGAAHRLDTLQAAEGLGVTVGGAIRVAHRRLELGPARRGPLDRRDRLTLHELLAAARPSTPLMLDLRGVDPRLPRLLWRALNAAGTRSVLVASRSWWMLDSFRGRPGTRIVPIVTSGRQLGLLLRRCDTEPLDGMAVAARLVTPATAPALCAMTRMLLAWPVDSGAEAERLRTLGVTGLIADRPSVALGADAGPLAA